MPTIKKRKATEFKLACRKCKRATKHDVLASDSSDTDIGYGEWWHEENHLVKCRGCDSVALYRHSYGSMTLPEVYDEIFPSPLQTREPLEDYFELPIQLRNIYLETLKAANSEQPILTGIGIRAIVETVCKERRAVGRTLAAKIDNLVTQGLLTRDGAKLLHKLRVIGNKAAHEVKPHTLKELSLALDVVNHLLLGVYILPAHVDQTFS